MLRNWLMVMALLVSTGPGFSAQTAVSKEYQVKAVFLFNFAQFVQWPSDTFATADKPFLIGILGDDPFDDFLDDTVRGEKVDGHPLIIRRYEHLEEARDCQILFISRSQYKRIENILASLKGRNILTVGDTDGFTRDGGIVGFFMERNKVHFKINVEAAKRGRLSISSKVLRLASIDQGGN